MIKDIIESTIGLCVLSAIWGLGLSTLFYDSCNGYGCSKNIYVTVRPEKIINEYYNYGTEKCYQYVPMLVKC